MTPLSFMAADESSRVELEPLCIDKARDTDTSQTGTVEQNTSSSKDSDGSQRASTLPVVMVTPSKSKSVVGHSALMPRSSTQAEAESPIQSPSTSKVAPLVTPRQVSNIFAHAQVLLSTNTELPITGREEQRAQLISFLASRFPAAFITPQASARDQPPFSTVSTPSLYVSGPPGIGKTALVSSVLHEFRQRLHERSLTASVAAHIENCSSLALVDNGGSSVWERLGFGLGMDMSLGSGKTKRTARQAFEAALQDGRSYLIVLDEIDHIQASKASQLSNDLLNALFGLAHTHTESLTLIGIANALDLATKSIRIPGMTNALHSKGKGKELFGLQLVHFRAYSGPELEAIVGQRLRRLVKEYPLRHAALMDSHDQQELVSGPLPLVAEPALKLCALKISARNGDVRAVLEVVRRAIATVEAAESRKRSTESQPTTPTKTTMSPSYFARPPPTDSLSSLNPQTAPRVSMAIMSASLRKAGFGVPPAVASLLADLNLNARLALTSMCIAVSRCSNAGFESKGFDRTIGLKQIYETYREALVKEGTLKPVNLVEFEGAIGMLESVALIQEPRTKPTSSNKRGPRRSPSKKADAERQLALSTVALDELVEALQVVPANSCDCAGGGLSAGALQETLRISKSMLDDEAQRVTFEQRKRQVEKQARGRDTMAPREGFNGDGLDEPPTKKSKSWLGRRRTACDAADVEGSGLDRSSELNEAKENEDIDSTLRNGVAK